MGTSSIKTIFQFIKNNKRYFAVGIIFLFIFMMGENLERFSDKELGIPQKATEQVVTLNQQQNFFLKEGFINARGGDYYRLVFNVKANEDCKLIVKITSPFGEEHWTRELELEESLLYERKEIIFDSPGYFRNLILERENPNDDVSIMIKDIKTSRLRLNSQAEVERLRTTVIGNTTDLYSPLQTEEDGAGFGGLKKNNQILGQVFRAESPYLGGVVFSGRKVGTGGAGKYRLKLYEAQEKDDGLAVKKNLISFTEFPAKNLSNYLNEEDELVLPISAILKKGKLYYLGLSNVLAKTNMNNYWELRGSETDIYPFGSALATSTNLSVKENKGDLYFKIVAKDYTQQEGERLLTGAMLEDLGGGLGKYSYQNKGEATDFLDLYSYTATSKQGNSSSVKYNEYEGTISATPAEGINYIYKINTIYPFEKIKLNAEQMYSNWYKVKLLYSFNKEDWTELPYQQGDKSPQIFDEVIKGNGNQNELYIKVTYDEGDDKEIKLFGLRYFGVVASLKF